MTIPALTVISALVGASIAFSARIQIRTLQRPVFSGRYFIALMMFEGMILLPIGAYFYSFYPDWSWMYLTDTSTLNNGMAVMSMAIYPVAATMGYLIGYYSAKSASDWVTIMFMVFMIIGVVGLFAVARSKIMWIGTYEQYHRAVGLEKITSTSLLPSTILAAGGLGVCWAYLLYRFVQEGNLTLKT